MRSRQRWPAELLLVRHAESMGNVARDLAESTNALTIDVAERDMDVPVSDRGREQARALGDWLCGLGRDQPTVVLASPYVRAVDTARRVLASAQLEMTVHQALEFYAAVPAIREKLQTLQDVGLGYIRLGQAATTLSGGEAQRIKIATELSTLQRSRHTVYILDEPTTGLHLADVERLLASLNRLVDTGHTVVLIEHHMDVIKTADHVIDLGPEGGHAGGRVVVTGTPEDVVKCKASHTGRFLRVHLRR